MYKITGKLRKKLKNPLGKIFKDVGKIKGKKIICVGDIISYEFIKKRKIPDLTIYDGKEKRKPVKKEIKEKIDELNLKKIELENAAGTIQEEAWIAISEGLKQKTKIKVKGEEDLLVLPCVLLSEKNCVVCYGQKQKGFVLIKVSEKEKKEIKKIIKEMEVC